MGRENGKPTVNLRLLAVEIVGTTFLLGSWYGLLLGVILVVGLRFRAVKEERVLRADLPGLEAYMTQVRYRFVPRVW